MKIPSILTVLLGLSSVATIPLVAESPIQARFPIAESTNLVVFYAESLQPLSMGGIHPDNSHNDRQSSFARVLKAAFREAGIPANIEVVRFGSRDTGDLDLTIMINRWDLNPKGEYECRFSAAISNGEETVDLGVFTGTYDELTIHQGRRTEFTYNVAARKAADKMVSLFTRA